VILTSLDVEAAALESRTGWSMKPEGACKGEVCVPLSDDALSDDAVTTGHVNVARLAERLRMPLLRDEAHGLWALGPESGGRALTTAQAPDLVLPDRHGQAFALSSLRGRKVLLVAWASW
jgi:hypothetical protein